MVRSCPPTLALPSAFASVAKWDGKIPNISLELWSQTAGTTTEKAAAPGTEAYEVRMLDPWDAAGEPAFVPRAADAPEGDGYIISVVYRAATNSSELLILNAQDIAGEPAAALKVPRRVPLAGISHGFRSAFASAM